MGYELEASLGSGPGSTIWRAVSTSGGCHGQKVVLTTVPAYTLEAEPIRLDNLLGVSELWHPSLAKTFNVGRHKGQVFIVEEYIKGASLREVAQGDHGQRPQLLRVLGIACKALAYLHERGLFHGGLTSRRVMQTESGWIKLRGAGLTKLGSSRQIADEPAELGQGRDRRAVAEMIDELELTDDARAGRALRELQQQTGPTLARVSEAFLSTELGQPAGPVTGWWQAPSGAV